MRPMIDPPEMREPDAPQRSPTLCSLISDPAVKGRWGECVYSTLCLTSWFWRAHSVIRADTEHGTDRHSVAPRSAPGYWPTPDWRLTVDGFGAVPLPWCRARPSTPAPTTPRAALASAASDHPGGRASGRAARPAPDRLRSRRCPLAGHSRPWPATASRPAMTSLCTSTGTRAGWTSTRPSRCSTPAAAPSTGWSSTRQPPSSAPCVACGSRWTAPGSGRRSSVRPSRCPSASRSPRPRSPASGSTSGRGCGPRSQGAPTSSPGSATSPSCTASSPGSAEPSASVPRTTVNRS